MRLRDAMLDTPKHVPGLVVISVSPSSNPTCLTTRHRLRALSPEETRHAMILAIKRDIDRQLPVDEWRRIVLTSAVQFKVVEEADVGWAAMVIREGFAVQCDAVCYSSVTPPIWDSKHNLSPQS